MGNTGISHFSRSLLSFLVWLMKIIAINCKHRKNCECCPRWQFIIIIITLSPKIINIPQNPMWLFIICDWGTIITFWGYIISFWGNIINFWGTILIGGIITLWGDFQLGPRLLTFGGILLTFGGVIIINMWWSRGGGEEANLN